jgi:hypothetical protein
VFHLVQTLLHGITPIRTCCKPRWKHYMHNAIIDMISMLIATG